MLRKLNTLLTIILIAVFVVACQASHDNTIKTSDKSDNTETQSIDFSQQIEGKYWQLIKLEGQPVIMAENQQREVHFKLIADENKITGFSGCNNFFGHYELKPGMRIKFSQMATTLMACAEVNVDEHTFLDVLKLTDNYSLRNDTLQLNVGRRAPLAVFKAVYFD